MHLFIYSVGYEIILNVSAALFKIENYSLPEQTYVCQQKYLYIVNTHLSDRKIYPSLLFTQNKQKFLSIDFLSNYSTDHQSKPH